jgi:hypothetical protein
MLMKILLTVTVILAAILVLRRRVQRVAQVQPVRAAPLPAAKSRLPYFIAYTLLLVMLGGAGFFMYLQWQDSYQVVNVRVIDSRTGNVVHYQARRGDVEGRRFRALDGRDVTLADVERMELGGE